MQQVLKSLNQRFATDDIYIDNSNIPGAGIGVFADKQLPENKIIGEYTGDIIPATYVHNNYTKFRGNHYLMQIRDKHKIIAYINGRDSVQSNWTKYINSFRRPNYYWRCNVKCYQYAKKIKFKTIREIPRGSEIIMDYGDDYW